MPEKVFISDFFAKIVYNLLLKFRQIMKDYFQNLQPVDDKLFYKKNDRNDLRLGEIVPLTKYEEADIVIIGCPQDEGVKISGGREGSANAPETIRAQFYQLTPFGISAKVCDLGNVIYENSLNETHNSLKNVVETALKDGKKLIVLGGGNDISYSNSKAMAETFGAENWLGVNISSKFAVRLNEPNGSESAYRRILEEDLIKPRYLYEIGYQSHFTSPVYYRYLKELGVNLSSIEQIRSRETADLELREMMRQKFVHHSETLTTFFGFSLSVVRAADAPGTNSPSPIGLRAGEFIQIVKFAASLSNTKIVQFTDVNPTYDVDDRTSKLVAIAMHRCCNLTKKT